MKRTPAKESPRRVRTTKQRQAIARRNEQHEIREHLNNIARHVELFIPEGCRADVLNALRCVLHGGTRMVMACGKAAVLRTGIAQYGPLKADYWPFVTLYDAQFRQHMPVDVVQNWETSSYPELLGTPAASERQP